MTKTPKAQEPEINPEVRELKAQLQQPQQNANNAIAQRDKAIVSMVLTLFGK